MIGLGGGAGTGLDRVAKSEWKVPGEGRARLGVARAAWSGGLRMPAQGGSQYTQRSGRGGSKRLHG